MPVIVVDPDDTSQALAGVVSISAGGINSCAVMLDGTARCWGDNRIGQLGNGTTTDSTVPVTVVDPDDTSQALAGVVSISAGFAHTCAVMLDGTARCWGGNEVGQLGDGTTISSNIPVRVIDLVDTPPT